MIVLVRHGQTPANEAGLLLGRDDVALTNLGQQQAALTASAVVGASEVVCSPLLRARQTAGVLGPSTDIRIDDRWTEIDYGEYDGWPMSEGPAPPWEIWRADPESTPPGGESLAAEGGCAPPAKSSPNGQATLTSWSLAMCPRSRRLSSGPLALRTRW